MMARKQKFEIEMVCESCGAKPQGKREGNWDVFSTVCDKCGGKVKPVIKDGADNGR